MRIMPRRIGAIVFMLCALYLGGGTARAQTPPPLWQSWLQNLAAAGYGIVQGESNVFTASYCSQYIIPSFGTCFNNDAADPYVTPLMPVGNAYIDPYFGPAGAITLPNGTVVGQDFFLAPTEAQLVIINLPPQAAYFGFQSYVFSRPNADYPHGARVASPDPARGELFAAFKNSINDKTIQAQSQLSFGSGTIAIITTPNAALATDMIAHFAAVQGNPDLIFTDAMGSNLNPGLDAASDDFLSVIRYLIPKNGQAGTNWFNHAASNVLVYRIDQPASLPVTRFGANPDATKSYNASELSLAADLAELSQLAESWLAGQEQKSPLTIRQATASEQVSSTGTPLSGTYGPICIMTGNYCVGADDDTATYWDAGVGKLPADGAFIVDGVNHAVTNNSTQLSVNAVDETTDEGEAAATQTNPEAAGFTSGTLTGSAAAFLKGNGLWGQASAALKQASPELYVHIFSRGCTASQTYCAADYTTIVPPSLIPYADFVGITVRAYLLPGYLNGANPYYLLDPDAIF